MNGETLKRLRKEAGLSQEQCSEVTGFSQSMISGFEKAEFPNYEYIIKLYRYLKKPLYEFIISKEELSKIFGIKPDYLDIIKEMNKLPDNMAKRLLLNFLDLTELLLDSKGH